MTATGAPVVALPEAVEAAMAPLVDALSEVSSYANLAHVLAPNDESGPRELFAARQAIFAAFAAALAAEREAGRAEALAAVDAACERLRDGWRANALVVVYDDDQDGAPDAAWCRPTWGVSAFGGAGDGGPASPTPTAAILAAAAGLDAQEADDAD